MEPNRRRTRSATKKKPPLKALEQKDEANNKAKQIEVNNGSPTRTSSPEPNCSICLGTLENKSFTDSCFHMFCFVCLQEWSKVKAECPLCKQKFSSIIHNVRSYEDYDQYPIPQKTNNAWEDSEGRNFHYRTTLTLERRLMIGIPGYHSRPHQEHDYTLQRPTQTVTTRTQWRRRRQSATTDFRRRIYINGLRVIEVQDRRLRVRQITPEFFRYNEACCHRLIPWLNRELNALLPHNHEHVRYVLDFLLSIIKSYPIRSEEFYQHVYPYIGRHTRHFMHEFENFAKSPYNMAAYDQHAVYQPHAVTVESDSDTESISSGHVEEDDDVVIISPVNPPASQEPPEPSAPQVDPHSTASYLQNRAADSMTFNDLAPLFNRVSNFLDLHNSRTSATTGGWDSPTPGPSWLIDNQSQQRQETPLDLRSPVKTETVRTQKSWSDMSSDDSDSSSSDSSDIVFMGYDKPWEERSPILLSSDSDEQKVTETKRKNYTKTSKSEHKQRKGSNHSEVSRRPHFYDQSRSSRRYRYRSRSRSRSRSYSRRSERRERSRHVSGGRHRSEARGRKRNRSRSISSERSKSQTSSSSRHSLSHSKRHRSRSESLEITGCCRNKHKKKDKKSRHKKHKHKKHRKHKKESNSHVQSKVVVVNNQTHEHIQKCSDEEKEIDVVSSPSNAEVKETTLQPLVNTTLEQTLTSDIAEPYINVVDDQDTPTSSPEFLMTVADELSKSNDAVKETCMDNSHQKISNEDNSSQSKIDHCALTTSENPEKSYKKHPSGHKKSSLKNTSTSQSDRRSSEENVKENHNHGQSFGETDQINEGISHLSDTRETVQCNQDLESSNKASSTPVDVSTNEGDTTSNVIDDMNSPGSKTSVIVPVPDIDVKSSLRLHSPNNNVNLSELPMSQATTLTTPDCAMSAFENLSVIGSLFKRMPPIPSNSNNSVTHSKNPQSLDLTMNNLPGENNTESRNGVNTSPRDDEQYPCDNAKLSDLPNTTDERQKNDYVEIVAVDDEGSDPHRSNLNWHVKDQSSAKSPLDTEHDVTSSKYHRSLLPSLEHLSHHFSQPCGFNPTFVQKSNKENPIEIDSSSSEDSEDEYNRPGPSHQTYTPPRSCVIVPPPAQTGLMTGFTKACPVVLNSDDENSSDSSTCEVTGTSKSSKVGYFLSDVDSDETDMYVCSDTEVSSDKLLLNTDNKETIEGSTHSSQDNVLRESNNELLSKVIDLSTKDKNHPKNPSEKSIINKVNAHQNFVPHQPPQLDVTDTYISLTDTSKHSQQSTDNINTRILATLSQEICDAAVSPSQPTENTNKCTQQPTKHTDIQPHPTENDKYQHMTNTPQPLENTDTCPAQLTENSDTCPSQSTRNTDTYLPQIKDSTDISLSQPQPENNNKHPPKLTDTNSAHQTENTDICPGQPTENTDICPQQPTENTDTCPQQLTENTDTCPQQPTENTDICPQQPTENTDTCPPQPTENTEACPPHPTENKDTCSGQPTENTDTCPLQPMKNTSICPQQPKEYKDICQGQPTKNTDKHRLVLQQTENTDTYPLQKTENTDTYLLQPVKNTETYPPQQIENTDTYPPQPIENTDTYPPQPIENTDTYPPQPIENTDTYLPQLTENTDLGSSQSLENTGTCPMQLTENIDTCPAQQLENTDTCLQQMGEH